MKKFCARCNFPLGAPVFRLMLIHHVENGLRIISIMLPCSTLLSTMQWGKIIFKGDFFCEMYGQAHFSKSSAWGAGKFAIYLEDSIIGWKTYDCSTWVLGHFKRPTVILLALDSQLSPMSSLGLVGLRWNLKIFEFHCGIWEELNWILIFSSNMFDQTFLKIEWSSIKFFSFVLKFRFVNWKMAEFLKLCKVSSQCNYSLYIAFFKNVFKMIMFHKWTSR